MVSKRIILSRHLGAKPLSQLMPAYPLVNLWHGLVIASTEKIMPLKWSYNERYHRRLDCLLSRMFRCRSKKTSKLRITGLCEGNPPVAGGFPLQRASNAENVSIWWRHDGYALICMIACWSIFWFCRCDFDMRYFPYDVQHCTVKMGSWTYDGSDVISYLLVFLFLLPLSIYLDELLS